MGYNRNLGVMIPSISNPYTYLNIILQDESPEIQKIGEQALGILANGMISLENEDNKINNLIFLKDIAERQRVNEISFLKAKIKELEQLGEGSIYKSLIEKLDANVDSFDYVGFTKALNSTLTSIKSFQNRLNSITLKNGGLYREEELLRNVDDNLLKTFTEERTHFSYGKNEIIRQLTLQFIKNYGVEFITNQSDPLNIAAAAIIIQQALARYLADNQKLTKYDKNFQINKENFIQEYEKLVGELDDFYKDTNISKIFSNTNILEEAKEMFGFVIEDPININKHKEYAVTKLKRVLDNDPFFDLPDLKNIFSNIKVTWKGKNKSSALEEIMLLLVIDGLQLGQLNQATDTLGQFEFFLPDIESEYKVKGKSPTQQMLQELRSELIKEKAANDPKKTTEIYRKKLQELDTKINGIAHSFIIHDTVKLYKSLESNNSSNFSSFTGRQMNIFNYIDSIAEMGHNFGANTEWMKFAAYNLSESAIGSFNKQPLETVFTIAAGLIMFDDFAIAAQEIKNNIEYSNITNLHLYQVQGIYVPSSYVLTETYNNMVYFLEHSGPPKDNSISATISAPSINFQDNNNTTIEDWNNIKQKAHNTKVTLHFMANFLNFVGQMLKY